MHDIFVMKKWLNHSHVSMNGKNLQNLSLKGNHFFTISKRVFDTTVVEVITNLCKISYNCSD